MTKQELKLRIAAIAECGLRISLAVFFFIFAGGLTVAVSAQDPTQTTNPQSAIRNPQSSTPQSDKRVGVDAGKRAPMTLRDVMLMALENNRDIEVERFNVQMNEFDVRSAEGVYDPSLSSSLFYDRRNTPIANPLAG